MKITDTKKEDKRVCGENAFMIKKNCWIFTSIIIIAKQSPSKAVQITWILSDTAIHSTLFQEGGHRSGHHTL